MVVGWGLARQRLDGSAICIFNGQKSHTIKVDLTCESNESQVLFQPSPLFFHPTHCGSTSSRTLQLCNQSRVPVAFKIEVPESLEGVVTLEPESGVIRGNDEQSLRVVFAPRSLGRVHGESLIHTSLS